MDKTGTSASQARFNASRSIHGAIRYSRNCHHAGTHSRFEATVGFGALSCLTLIGMHGAATLLLARALQGSACGLGSTSLGAYVIDSAPKEPRWLPAAITGSAPMAGIPIGALGCGALVEFAPMPRVLTYTLIATLLVLCGALIALSPETMRRTRGALTSLRPHLHVPAGSPRLLLAASAAFVATWSYAGFNQAFGPSVAAEYLGTTNPLVAAVVFASVAVLNPLGGPLTAHWSAPVSVRAGMGLFSIALLQEQRPPMRSIADRITNGSAVAPCAVGPSLRQP